MALKVSFPYTDDFQQLQIELCVLREEMKVMHDKVQRIVKTKKHGEEYVCWMVHANRDCCISSSHDIDVKMCYAIYIYIFNLCVVHYYVRLVVNMIWICKTVLLSWLCSMCGFHFIYLCLVCFIECG